MEKNKRAAEDKWQLCSDDSLQGPIKAPIKSIMPCVAVGMLRVKSSVLFANYHTDIKLCAMLCKRVEFSWDGADLGEEINTGNIIHHN